ncbi:MAG: Wzz/FepE/Etk N-terminal domain-containing protein [Bacillota bacterium]|nr:Wzz/FepE/Etk N-terminal domain-containing protein [Bacillota bacterium]
MSQPVPGTQPQAPPPYDDEIDLRDLVLVLWRYRWMITGVFVLAVAAAAALSFLLPPVYKVSTTIALGQFNSPVYTNPAAAKEVLRSDDLLLKTIKELNLDVPMEEFRGFKEDIEVTPVKDTNMLQVSIMTADRAEGKAVVEKMVELFKEDCAPDYEENRTMLANQLTTVQRRLLDVEKSITKANEDLAAVEAMSGLSRGERDFRRSQVLETLRAFEEQRIGLLDRYLGLQKDLDSLRQVTTVRSAREPVYPEKPNKKLNVAVAGVLGLMLGVFGAFVLDYFRRNPLDLKGS